MRTEELLETFIETYFRYPVKDPKKRVTDDCGHLKGRLTLLDIVDLNTPRCPVLLPDQP